MGSEGAEDNQVAVAAVDRKMDRYEKDKKKARIVVVADRDEDQAENGRTNHVVAVVWDAHRRDHLNIQLRGHMVILAVFACVEKDRGDVRTRYVD